METIAPAFAMTITLLGCLWRFATLSTKLQITGDMVNDRVAAYGKEIDALKTMRSHVDTIPNLDRRLARVEIDVQDVTRRCVRLEARDEVRGSAP